MYRDILTINFNISIQKVSFVRNPRLKRRSKKLHYTKIKLIVPRKLPSTGEVDVHTGTGQSVSKISHVTSKNDGLYIYFLGVFFPISPFIFLIFMTSHV